VLSPSGKLLAYTYGTEPQEWFSSVNSVPLNEWVHVAFTYDGATIKIYINGLVDASGSRTGGITITGEWAAIGRVGIQGGVETQYGARAFEGIIDEVRISNVARTTFDLTSAPSLDGNTVALWHFDEGTGDVVDDVADTPHADDGTICGASWTGIGPTWTAGKFGNALLFDGMDDLVRIVPASTSLDITDTITIEAWIKPSSPYSIHGDIVRRQKGYELCLLTNGKIEIAFPYTGPSGWWDSTSTIPIPAGDYYHVAFTYDKDGGANNLKIYVNGLLDAQHTVTGALQPEGILGIGAVTDGGSYWWFDGIIDEVRIWDQALTADQVQASYDLRHGTQIKEKDLDEDGYPDVIFTSAFYELSDGDPLTLTVLPVASSVSITGVTINRVTPKPNRTYGNIVVDWGSASAYSVPVTVYNIDSASPPKPPCKTIHMWLELSTGDHVGVNAQFQR